MKDDDLSAEQFLEDLLHNTSDAYRTNTSDFAVQFFQLPYVVETPLAKSLLETENEIHKVFANVRAYFRTKGVTQLVRTSVKARHIGADLVGATHVTRLLRADGSAYRNPYPTYSILVRTRMEWKVASSLHAILDSDEQCRAFLAPR